MHEPIIPSRPHTDEEFLSHPPMLVNEISRLFFDRMRQTDPPGVLSQHGCRLILLALLRAERSDPAHTGLTQRALADITHLKAPTVSGVLREMEEEGLIIRLADEKDARATRVRLTEAGRAANDEIRTRLRGVGDILMRGFSKEESDTLGLLLLRMRDNILGKEHAQ